MARKQTREELQAAHDRASKQATLNYRYMYALHAGTKITWSDWVGESGYKQARYKVGVFDLDSPCGGYAVTVFQHPGQRDQIDVYAIYDLKAAVFGRLGEYDRIMNACLYDVASKVAA